MDLLKKLTLKNLKLNKKRTIVTIIGIMLSVALITAVATMYSSALSSLINFETQEKGDFHVVFYDVPTSEVKSLKNNRKIKDVYLTRNIGYTKLENSKNENKPYAYIKGFTKEALENLSVKLKEGRLPENENEIVIPTHLKTNGRISLNVGDTITLNVGKRVSDNIELNQQNKFDKDANEEIINTEEKTYKIVGIIERPASNIEGYSAPGYTFITAMNEISNVNKVDVFCKYTEEGTKDYINVTANILGVNEELYKKFLKSDFSSEEDANKIARELEKEKYQSNINTYLIDLETNPLDNNTVGSLGTLVVVVCIIIVFTSVFCIKNSFDISISEKTKQYGMLKSIGSTKKQIRKNVFFEGTLLGLIGIPLGLLSGIIASSILVVVSNYFIADMFEEGIKLVLRFSWKAFLIAIALGIVTIYLSALRSARRASKVSPIDSIRNSGDIKIKSKKMRSPKIINKLFGIGGEISYKNLKRNRKKYRTTVISITVSTFVFIALSYFMNLAMEEVKSDVNLRDYNLSLLVNTEKGDELYKKVLDTTTLDNIKEYSIVKYDNFNIDKPQYSSEYKKVLNIDSDENDDALDGSINVRTINNEQYKKYINNLGLNYEEMKDKAILVDEISVSEEKNSKQNIRVYSYNKNDTIRCKTTDDKQFDLQIGYVTDKVPFGIEKTSEFILLSEDTFEKYFNFENVMVYYDSSNCSKLQDDIDELLKGYNYNINNVEENANIMKKLFTLIGIFLYGFIIVISAIGITNIFNTITTNMELRKPEFAMLKSIGMTSKEFGKMIRLETIFMGIKSLVFSIPIGIGLSYLIYNSLEASQGVNFEVPIKSILIAIVVVFLLITCIMKYSIGKINKQNTIETIRNENI